MAFSRGVLYLCVALALSQCGVGNMTVLGGWESSGGSGIGCFLDPKDAEQADIELARSGTLSLETKQKLASVVALEVFETSDVATFEARGRSTEEILGEVHRYIAEYAPIFHERIQLVGPRISQSTWSALDSVPRVDDAKPAVKIPPLCRQLQLAVRRVQSTQGKMPQVHVVFDRYLFEQKMDALNRAALVLHEEMYLLGKEIGHTDSVRIRPLVAWMMSGEIHQIRNIFKTHSLAALNFQSRLGDAYGDYYLFFADDPVNVPSVKPTGLGQYSRFMSFGRMLRYGRERKGKCLDDHQYDNASAEKKAELDNFCSAFALQPNLFTPHLDDEQTFVYLARWFVDRFFDDLQTSENLVTWNRSDPMAITELQQKELTAACNAMKRLPANEFLRLAREKAISYCANLAKP